MTTPSSQDKLGLCDPPVPTYLYIGQDEEKRGCWYTLNYDTRIRTFIPQRGLRGYLVGIRAREVKSERYGKKWKIELLIDADRLYVIRAGAETVFARGLILALAAVESPEALHEVMTICVAPSEQNSKIVFGSVYCGNTLIKFQWDNNAPLMPLVQYLQSVVGSGGSDTDVDSHEGEGEDDSLSGEMDPEAQAPQQRRAGLATSEIIKEIKRCGAQVGYVTDANPPMLDLDKLNEYCASLYEGRVITELTVAEAIDFRKTLLSA
jgi:hypothetical protein